MTTADTLSATDSPSDTSLPAGFAMLEPFVAQWAASSAAERAERRMHSSEAQREAFFSATADRVEAALTELDKKKLAEFNPEENRLMNLLLSFAHVALAVEIQRDHEAKQAGLRQHMKITHASADR